MGDDARLLMIRNVWVGGWDIQEMEDKDNQVLSVNQKWTMSAPTRVHMFDQIWPNSIVIRARYKIQGEPLAITTVPSQPKRLRYYKCLYENEQ